MKTVINHAYKEGLNLSKPFGLINPSNIVRLEDNNPNLAHNDYSHSFCPAFKAWHKNKWKIILNKDLKIKINKKDKTIETNISLDKYGNICDAPWKSLPAPRKDLVDKSIFPWKNSKFTPAPGISWDDKPWPEESLGFMMDFADEKKIELQFFFVHLFWTEAKDVWLSVLHDPLLSRNNIEVIPATFPISVWPRPIVFSCKIIDTNIEEIFLPKDTVLYHISFYSRYQDPYFIIKSKHIDQKITKILIENEKFKKKYKGQSWRLVMERLKKDKPSKCPFFNFFK